MSYSLDFNIRERLAAYLAQECSLREFEDWFFAETWDVDRFGDLALINLVYGIKLRLAEFSNGDWTEGELHDLLRPFIVNYDVYSPGQVRVQYGTSSINSRVPTTITYSGRLVDIESSTAYA